VNEGSAARQWYIEARSWQGLHRHALMTMMAYAFLQHRRLASDVILEALAGSGACDAALQMADATIIQTLCWPRKGSRNSFLNCHRTPCSSYRSHDLFLFPSLHDSGGFVVLEARSHGLPVICLDLGGPRDMVTANSGVAVMNNGQDSAQLATTMAGDICRLLASPEKLAALSAGAVARAQDFILSQRIKRFYDCAMEFIPRSDATVARRLD
jgi:hypothetical protein